MGIDGDEEPLMVVVKENVREYFSPLDGCSIYAALELVTYCTVIHEIRLDNIYETRGQLKIA